MTHPIAPAKDTPNKVNVPVETKYPENGMIISEGRGMHADSIAIIKATPEYPIDDIPQVMKLAKTDIIAVIISIPNSKLPCHNPSISRFTLNI